MTFNLKGEQLSSRYSEVVGEGKIVIRSFSVMYFMV